MNFIKANSNRLFIAITIMTVMALPVLTSARGKIFFYTQRDAAASASRHPGGVNVLFGDGSVRFISGGIRVAVSDINTAATAQWVKASRISLPNSPLEFSYVDSNDPNAENKARALFDAAYRMRRGVVVTIVEGEMSVSGKLPAVNFFVNDGADSRVLEVKLQDVLVSGYQTGGGGDAVAVYSVSFNFSKIEYVTLKTTR